MLERSVTIANYRDWIGRAKRSIAKPVERTDDWIRAVRKRCGELRLLGGDMLARAADDLRRSIEKSTDLVQAERVIESFALTTIALRRVHDVEFYDQQLAGGFVLAAGAIAEIQTGEGKTFTTLLPAVLHAMRGRGVHIATTNEYLSGRDCEQLRGVYEMLGLSVGRLATDASIDEKADAYRCDITYGPGYEFGFDFLRDQVAILNQTNDRLGTRFLRRLSGVDDRETTIMQPCRAFAIVDEADSVMIDEATTPLVLSGKHSRFAISPQLYHFARQVAMELSVDQDFEVNPANREVQLTESGSRKTQRRVCDRPPGMLARPWSQLVKNALHAEYVFRCDVDYVVNDGAVAIVDPNTGRIHTERKWTAGLHQAVEVKEGIEPSGENQTNARITRQRYLSFYDTVAGLTGTALDSEGEFRESYGLPVVPIATHKPCLRELIPLRCFSDCETKFRAIIDQVARRTQAGQPVLVGTQSIDESTRLSDHLDRLAMDHVVLNGVQDETEASIIANAGRTGQVTIATHMAGRGTDIKPDRAALLAGGLHVISTRISHCRRVDRQLAGRSARQGDPGSCQFFASSDDDLIKTYAPQLAAEMQKSARDDGECRQDFSKPIRAAQQSAEQDASTRRRQMVAHDDWIESVQATLAGRQ